MAAKQTRARSPALAEALNQQLTRCSNEVTRRSTTQDALQAAYLTIVTAISGAVLSAKDRQALLLLVPPVAVTIWSLWIDNHQRIHELGDFMADRLEPALAVATADGAGPSGSVPFDFWETYAARRRDDRPLTWSLPILLLFFAVPLAALGLGFEASVGDDGWRSVLGMVWVADVVALGWSAMRAPGQLRRARATSKAELVWEVLAAAEPSELSFDAFERAFKGSVRARLDFEKLRAHGPEVTVRHISEPEELGGLSTVWYETGDYRGAHPPMLVSEVARNPSCLTTDQLRAVRDGVFEMAPRHRVIATYRVPGAEIVIDGNHRAVSGFIFGVSTPLLVVTVVGPVDTDVLPDLRHF